MSRSQLPGHLVNVLRPASMKHSHPDAPPPQAKHLGAVGVSTPEVPGAGICGYGL